MNTAPKPTRGDKIIINFGMVQVPVTLYNAVDENNGKIKRSRYSPAGNPIKQQNVDAETGEIVEYGEFVMKYTTAEGELVELTDAEISAATGIENGDSETLGVVSELIFSNPALIEGTFQVRPQTLKQGSKSVPAYNKPFALFMKALVGQAVIVRYTTRGGIKTVAINSKGEGVVLRPSNQIREELPAVEAEFSEAELKMAKQIVATMKAEEADVLPNGEEVDRVREYAEAKASGEELVLPEAKTATVKADDLMALLEASLA